MFDPTHNTTTMKTTDKPRLDVYQAVTDRIIEALEQGTPPWRKDWTAINSAPRNWDGRGYRGINWLLLGILLYANPVFVTFNKAKALGGQVRKGEKGHIVTLWKFFKGKDATTGLEKVVPMLKHFYVWNVAQCDGLPDLPQVEAREFEPLDMAEQIISAMPSPPHIDECGNGRCYYQPKNDAIHMTERVAFKSSEGFYSTLFHELGHATGHESRLARKTLMEGGGFGSQTYSREELVAELTAANLCAVSGISNPELEVNHAAYCAGWAKVLKEDPKAIVWAAGQAAKAADCILGRKDEPMMEEATA